MATESERRAGDQLNHFAPEFVAYRWLARLESAAWIDQNAAPRLPRRDLG